MHNVIRGGIAGAIATAPMTWTMKAADRYVPRQSQGRLPPRQITEHALEKAAVKHRLANDHIDALTVAAHYGFGAAAGGLLGAAAGRLPLPRPIAGAAVGMAVWAASYLGWLPAAKVRRSAIEEPAGRNMQMIVAHLVWGAVAGSLLDAVSVRELES
ncbi:MAG: hypothetical protein DCC67_00545 [Planctomycetota bacterium]|nr:MAG: hypothetical protein DCC67_00545 [Planctomycetota bacterium]